MSDCVQIGSSFPTAIHLPIKKRPPARLPPQQFPMNFGSNQFQVTPQVRNVAAFNGHGLNGNYLERSGSGFTHTPHGIAMAPNTAAESQRGELGERFSVHVPTKRNGTLHSFQNAQMSHNYCSRLSAAPNALPEWDGAPRNDQFTFLSRNVDTKADRDVSHVTSTTSTEGSVSSTETSDILAIAMKCLYDEAVDLSCADKQSGDLVSSSVLPAGSSEPVSSGRYSDDHAGPSPHRSPTCRMASPGELKSNL